MAIDNATRVQINTALAKVIAYRNCGKDPLADEWSVTLMQLLESHHLIKENTRG